MKITPEQSAHLLSTTQHKIKVEPMALVFFGLGMFLTAFFLHVVLSLI